jgi:hypothetical protein
MFMRGLAFLGLVGGLTRLLRMAWQRVREDGGWEWQWKEGVMLSGRERGVSEVSALTPVPKEVKKNR